MRSTGLVLLFALAACGDGKTARDENYGGQKREGNTPGLALTVCGTIASYQAATAGADGRVAVDRGSWPVAAGATIDERTPLRAGTDACIEMEMDPSRRVSRLVARAPLVPDWPTEE